MRSLCYYFFVFAPDRTIPILVINTPGNIHYSKVLDYGQIYKKLKYLYEEYGAKTVVDAAFLAKLSNHIIKKSQDITNKTRKEICDSF